MKTRIGIAALLFMLVQPVLFGAGITAVLATSLRQSAMELIPVVVIVSIIFAIPFSWWLAPRLRQRYWRAHRHDKSVDDKVLSSLS